jgi:undecaprenyl diphosphate synthase
MKQSNLQRLPSPGLHVALIMDGSGRWAEARGWPRTAGHRAGAGVVRRMVQAAPGMGIGTLTLFAFSSDNWQRPPEETRGLMEIFEHYLRTEAASWVERGLRINVLGRRDRIPSSLRLAIESAEEMTCAGHLLCLQLAIDYSSRETLVQAAREFKEAQGDGGNCFPGILAQVMHGDPSTPEVDLVIRTGGEQRLSDFLLWECAYAELFFTPVLWPDFDAEELRSILAEFRSRHRRFGRIADAAAV